MAILSPPAQLPDKAPPAEPQQQPVKRQIALWLWPTLITLAAAMYKIDSTVMGNDELATWEVARRSTGQIMATLHNVDAVHGTYYLFMHVWMTVFGDSPAAMRTPSALAVAAAAGLVALTGRRLFGTRAGLYAGLLFALVPAVGRFGQESRAYALVVLVAILATLLLLRALDVPRSLWRWGAYALCLACIGLLHLVALTIVLAHAVVVVSRARHGLWVLWSFGLAAAAGTACATPVIVLGLSHDDRQLFWVPEPTLWSLLEIAPQVFASALCAGAVFALAVLARNERREALLLCAALAVLPFLEIWVASQGEVSYFRYQYALFTLPAWSLLAGAGLASVTRSGVAAVAALTVLGLFTLPDHAQMREQYEHDVPHRVDYEAAARTIAKYHRPGDAVVFGRGYAWMLGGGVRYYLPRDMTLRETMVTTAADRDDLYSRDCPDPERCLGAENRVWVVVQDHVPDPLASIAAGQAKVLRAKFAANGTVQHTGVTVALMVRKPR